jgi:hypothetical protein
VSVAAILLPVFVQVALTFALLGWLGRSRFAALRARQVKVHEIALGERAWPPRLLQIQNAYHNQFETPVLFYVLVALALFTRQADMLFVVLSWMFVAARFVHAVIHTTSNVVSRRFMAFVVSTSILAVMWVVFAVRILTLGSGIR